MSKHDYQPITLDQVPDGVRFDVETHRQGHDRSEGPSAVRYYRLLRAKS